VNGRRVPFVAHTPALPTSSWSGHRSSSMAYKEQHVSTEFFSEVQGPIPFAGLGSEDSLAFKVYQPDRIVLDRRMEDWLRPGVCFWHSFAWDGRDMFGVGTLDRPWLDAGTDPMTAARMKMEAAFEFFTKLGIRYYCFHDRDVAPDGATYAETACNLDALVEDAEGYQEKTGVRLLWGTANLFSHPRYQGGAATNPDPEVFAFAAAQVKHMLEITKRLGGTNYVLWGGREGYDTLLNTDLAREGAQFARFLHLVAEHKAKIGFDGTLLIEPKPQEPTKHQYDYDSQTVHGFLARHGLDNEFKLNIEANHATLAGHSFHHEVAYAVANGVLGSIDANRGDPQVGWDTDQFPNSVEDMALALYEIVKAGGLATGGFNFDAKLRRQSTDRTDLFHAHIGGLDTIAQALLVAADLVERGTLASMKEARYAGWNGPLGSGILDGSLSLADLDAKVVAGEIDPKPASGRQELYENIVNRSIWSACAGDR
jgi:xylose isomerase